MINIKNKKRWISLLNFEGDVFKIFKQPKNSDTFDIVDFKGWPVEKNISANKVLSIYDGIEQIKTSEGRLYNISQEHPDAKPRREHLCIFLGLAGNPERKVSKKPNIKISVELSDKQQDTFDEWKEAIKYIYGEYGHFEWTISPTGIGNGIEVWSSLAQTSINLTDVENW